MKYRDQRSEIVIKVKKKSSSPLHYISKFSHIVCLLHQNYKHTAMAAQKMGCS
jgi:hypothetical protein